MRTEVYPSYPVLYVKEAYEVDGNERGLATWGVSRSPDTDPKTGEVYMVHVFEGHRNQKVGSQLIELAMDGLRSKGFETAIAWVEEADRPAQRFFERHGFTQEPASPQARKVIQSRGGIPMVRYRASLSR